MVGAFSVGGRDSEGDYAGYEDAGCGGEGGVLEGRLADAQTVVNWRDMRESLTRKKRRREAMIVDQWLGLDFNVTSSAVQQEGGIR